MRGLKELIPKAIEGQKESTDTRLRELNAELKSLKMLMGQRMNPPTTPTTSTSTFGRPLGSSSAATGPASGSNASNVPTSSSSVGEVVTPKPASVSSATGTEATASLSGRAASPFGAGIPQGRAAIPAWQMAVASKSSTTPAESGSGSVPHEASGSS